MIHSSVRDDDNIAVRHHLLKFIVVIFSIDQIY